ncbi:hypothetical protein VKT23_010865 [Stygiomarasmius scandens]|uniref:NACHT domain-containing protein n=1 Tax=Marasmiellus scandens TaxID=2682957 RepID=A0ABR1JBB1_9AGAR
MFEHTAHEIGGDTDDVGSERPNNLPKGFGSFAGHRSTKYLSRGKHVFDARHTKSRTTRRSKQNSGMTTGNTDNTEAISIQGPFRQDTNNVAIEAMPQSTEDARPVITPAAENPGGGVFQNAQNFSIQGANFTSYARDVIHHHHTGFVATKKEITADAIHLATPPVPKIFAGRDDLVNEGVQILCGNDPAYLAILGPGGIGKTSLALHISNAPQVLEKFRQYFLPCDILEDAASIIQGLIQVFRLHIQQGQSMHDTLYQFLGTITHSVLLILDNFETPWNYKNARTDVKHLIEKLSSFHSLSMIVTMRGTEGPGDIPWQKLGAEFGIPTLSLDAAME